MGGAKLDPVKKTLHFVVSPLTPKERLGLIVYDDSVELIFDLKYVNPENRNDIETKSKKCILAVPQTCVEVC